VWQKVLNAGDMKGKVKALLIQYKILISQSLINGISSYLFSKLLAIDKPLLTTQILQNQVRVSSQVCYLHRIGRWDREQESIMNLE